MESRLAQLAPLSQKDKVAAYQSLFSDLISREDQSSLAADVHTLVDNVVNQESVGLVISRLILSELVKALADGTVKDRTARKNIVEDTLNIIRPRIVSYEEQVLHARSHSEYAVALNRIPSGEHPKLPACRHLGSGGGLE